MRLDRCVDAAVRAMGIRRVPELFPPVAYSRLPTRSFTKGIDTGLVFQVSGGWRRREYRSGSRDIMGWLQLLLACVGVAPKEWVWTVCWVACRAGRGVRGECFWSVECCQASSDYCCQLDQLLVEWLV